MTELNTEETLAIVHRVLERRYGSLQFVSGQGIAKGQRVEFVDGNKTVRAVIKMSAGGRISFLRRKNGSWSGLSDSDRVIVVAPKSLNGNEIEINMFDRKSLIDAFELNHSAQSKDGKGNLPNWIAPFHEPDRGPRGAGDGFASKALWTEPFEHRAPADAPSAAERASGLTIKEAKEALAKTFGVSPDSIKITIEG